MISLMDIKARVHKVLGPKLPNTTRKFVINNHEISRIMDNIYKVEELLSMS